MEDVVSAFELDYIQKCTRAVKRHGYILYTYVLFLNCYFTKQYIQTYCPQNRFPSIHSRSLDYSRKSHHRFENIILICQLLKVSKCGEIWTVGAEATLTCLIYIYKKYIRKSRDL